MSEQMLIMGKANWTVVCFYLIRASVCYGFFKARDVAVIVIVICPKHFARAF